jgi:hypothetical protein
MKPNSPLSWPLKNFGGLTAAVISAAILSLVTWSTHASGFILNWSPNPAPESVTSYKVTVFLNHPTNSFTNYVISKLCTETNVTKEGYEAAPPSPPIVKFRSVTNVVQRLPCCAVVTNLHRTNVYWTYVQARNIFGSSAPSQTLVVFWPTNETPVTFSRTFAQREIQIAVNVDPGWHYYLKSSHGTPKGAIDPCCGTFFAPDVSEVHWNRLAELDYLGKIATNTSRLTFSLPRNPKLKHQLYRVFRARAVDALTNATRNPTIQYHE